MLSVSRITGKVDRLAVCSKGILEIRTRPSAARTWSVTPAAPRRKADMHRQSADSFSRQSIILLDKPGGVPHWSVHEATNLVKYILDRNAAGQVYRSMLYGPTAHLDRSSAMASITLFGRIDRALGVGFPNAQPESEPKPPARRPSPSPARAQPEPQPEVPFDKRCVVPRSRPARLPESAAPAASRSAPPADLSSTSSHNSGVRHGAVAVVALYGPQLLGRGRRWPRWRWRRRLRGRAARGAGATGRATRPARPQPLRQAGLRLLVQPEEHAAAAGRLPRPGRRADWGTVLQPAGGPQAKHPRQAVAAE
eukprot:365277-Chlamydomonas_euryale.AAC.16